MLTSLRSEGVRRMTEAKLAPNLPGWMVEHANRYLSSGGTDGHMHKPTQPGRPDITVPSLLLTTTGRKSGEKFIFPLYYGRTGDSYIVVASKGGAPQHPGWYRNILANPEVAVQAGTAKMKARARTATGEERARLWEKALEFWPPYADYQLKTEREIPVVVLDPRALTPAWSLRPSQNALGKPTCSRTPFAVCRLTIPTGTGKRRSVIGLYEGFDDCPLRSGQRRSRRIAAARPLEIEGCRHSRRGHHRTRLHALGDNAQFDLVARRREPVYGRDLGRDFEHARDKLLKGRCLGRQRQLVIRAAPHAGLVVPLRRDLESPGPDW